MDERKTVLNTDTPEEREKLLRDQMLRGRVGQIERQEAAGQASFVSSDVLPARGPSNRPVLEEDALIAALGIEWGELLPDDPLFRYAKLPPGWSKRPTEHSMWSEIVDEHGVVRADVFYKAAFYDRKAFLSARRPKPEAGI